MGKIEYFVRGISAVAVILLSLSSCGGEELMIIVDGPTIIYSDYPESGMPHQDKAIAVLNKGETGDVIHIRHSKDFQFYKIRLKDGRKGYVQFGDKFRVVSKTKDKIKK